MLSVIIIVKNEADVIERCLESIKFADEIIILDSGSNDNTVELCKAYTPHVFRTDWQGFGIQKQRALEKATGDWVLSIDADEEISTPLQAEIQQALQSNVDGFEIPRQSRYCGKVIQHGGWSPDYVLRLFKRKKGKFSPDLVHERVLVIGVIKKLTHNIKHEAFVSPDEVLNKINTYSRLGAKKLYNNGERSSLRKAILKGDGRLFGRILLKRLF